MIPDAQVNGVVFLKILETRLSGTTSRKWRTTRLSGEQVNGVVFLKILETRLSGEQVNGVVFLKILETRLSGEQVNGIVFLKILETSPQWTNILYYYRNKLFIFNNSKQEKILYN